MNIYYPLLIFLCLLFQLLLRFLSWGKFLSSRIIIIISLTILLTEMKFKKLEISLFHMSWTLHVICQWTLSNVLPFSALQKLRKGDERALHWSFLFLSSFDFFLINIKGVIWKRKERALRPTEGDGLFWKTISSIISRPNKILLLKVTNSFKQFLSGLLQFFLFIFSNMILGVIPLPIEEDDIFEENSDEPDVISPSSLPPSLSSSLPPSIPPYLSFLIALLNLIFWPTDSIES